MLLDIHVQRKKYIVNLDECNFSSQKTVAMGKERVALVLGK